MRFVRRSSPIIFCIFTLFLIFAYFKVEHKKRDNSSRTYGCTTSQLTRSNWEFKAAHGQDYWLLMVLGWPGKEAELHDMTFIEAGAFDGITGSNMYAVEKNLNWRGVCFEPNKDLFKLVSARRSCFKVNAGLCKTSGSFSFVQFEPPYDQESGILTLMSTEKRQEIDKKIDSGIYKIANSYEINCVSVSDALLRAFGDIIKVDVLSLDVESSELNVLKSIDFYSIVIDIIFVECSHEREILAFMSNTGLYEHVSKVGDDLVFFRKSSKYIEAWKNGCTCHQKGNECFFKFVAPDMNWKC